jgi:hypothetical protein
VKSSAALLLSALSLAAAPAVLGQGATGNKRFVKTDLMTGYQETVSAPTAVAAPPAGPGTISSTGTGQFIAEIDEDGVVLEALCDGGTGPYGLDLGGPAVPCAQAPEVRWGHSQPTWDATVHSSVTFGPLRLYAQVDAVGGHLQEDSSSPAAQTSLLITRLSNTRDDPIFEAYRLIGRRPLGTYDAGFARLRELSATYSLPERLTARVGATRGSVTLAGRNLMMLWTAVHGWSTPRSGLIEMPIGDGRAWDPETRAMGGTTGLTGSYQTVMPPLTSLNLTVRLGF